MPAYEHVRPAAGGAKLTCEDFLLFPDDGKRHELIDGVHVVTPPPDVNHQTISMNLSGMIWSFLQQHRIGRVFAAPFDVVFSNVDVVEPDLLYLSNERGAQILNALHAAGAPELVVEIGSPSTRRRDETIKRRLYERFGVAEYWIVDPVHEVVRVYRVGRGGYERVAELSVEHHDTLITPLLPGLELPLAAIFKI